MSEPEARTPPSTSRGGGKQHQQQQQQQQQQQYKRRSPPRPQHESQSELLTRLTASPRSGEGGTEHNKLSPRQEVERAISAGRNSPVGGGTGPIFETNYLSELRDRQQHQLESIATFIDSNPTQPVARIMGMSGRYRINEGYTYGPSYSRTLESLEPECEHFPATGRIKNRLAIMRGDKMTQQQILIPPLGSGNISSARSRNSNISSARSNISSSARRPGTANSSSSSARHHENTLFQVIKEIHPHASPRVVGITSSVDSAVTYGVPQSPRNNSNLRQQQQAATNSGRPLSYEYHYQIRQRPQTADNTLSKADSAILKHQKRKVLLEKQKAKLRDVSAVPMKFQWN